MVVCCTINAFHKFCSAPLLVLRSLLHFVCSSVLQKQLKEKRLQNRFVKAPKREREVCVKEKKKKICGVCFSLRASSLPIMTHRRRETFQHQIKSFFFLNIQFNKHQQKFSGRHSELRQTRLLF